MEIENIQQYIAETNIPAELRGKYDMMASEFLALIQGDDRADMTALAFNFGFAKCYRAVVGDEWYARVIIRWLGELDERKLRNVYYFIRALVGGEEAAQA